MIKLSCIIQVILGIFTKKMLLKYNKTIRVNLIFEHNTSRLFRLSCTVSDDLTFRDFTFSSNSLKMFTNSAHMFHLPKYVYPKS